MVAPLVVAAGIGAGASLLGSFGAARASAKEAAKNRDFQERLSNTAYTRAAADLEEAGLNRVLALGSPATTPGGAVGQVPDFGSAIAQGAQAGYGALSTASNIAHQQQSAAKMLEETKGISENNKRSLLLTDAWNVIAPILTEAAGDFGALVRILKEEAPSVMQSLIETAKESTQAIKDLSKVIISEFGPQAEFVGDWIQGSIGDRIHMANDLIIDQVIGD